ncbi:aspartyl/asparaginyl beta-hydroxylase domain-containing protein [Streptomyces mobaraensis NBRC 13819 = DSM 40847]|uniref:Aspartyl/asparaginyl beta-hydroxylase domain-containing protein n=2 Tax=Streptomyces mobaraensis TaxID=35621 RepID=A0A5N5VYN5_STRMB|nr:aspartyl/asparaginyl beta-hydroxylase domain-containing protein [Streptomyces mobaraensis]EME99228.1 peptide-aspartate beta-dioxygenase [Streptomyces mobaraensis NBRC 13819 = DSM 40847]KAB7833929.1 aspartyl/asparaginyl beta-hydroxylase domain-containing protein [Streptomyces mobaraensis]QTT72083.1 aspartyl/asparaginyl beta-hydroxylase domain-containing protein [Streptomyces mobaraensis NBRC 13819 = DSM 40847]
MTPTAPRRSGEVRTRYAELIDALRAEGDPEAAHRCARLAVEQGVWRHPAQRPVHYVPSLPPRPVYDPSAFWFTAHLEENFPAMRAELDRVTDPVGHGFLPVEEPLLGKGRWEQVTFYEAGQRFDDACARFPVTAAVIEGIPEASYAGSGVVTLSWLHPGTHIVPHCGGTNARLRVHLGLKVPEGPVMRVGEERLHWHEGRCLVFDDSFEHEVWHEGDAPRVVLLMDVVHPDLDASLRDAILAERTSFADRVTGFMNRQGISRVELADDAVRLFADPNTASLIHRHLREVGATAVELREGRLCYD